MSGFRDPLAPAIIPTASDLELFSALRGPSATAFSPQGSPMVRVVVHFYSELAEGDVSAVRSACGNIQKHSGS